MVVRKRDKQIVFRTTQEIEEKFKLALKASDETAQQILEEAVIEYINRKKSTIQKYTEYLQSIAQD